MKGIDNKITLTAELKNQRKKLVGISDHSQLASGESLEYHPFNPINKEYDCFNMCVKSDEDLDEKITFRMAIGDIAQDVDKQIFVG